MGVGVGVRVRVVVVVVVPVPPLLTVALKILLLSIAPTNLDSWEQKKGTVLRATAR